MTLIDEFSVLMKGAAKVSHDLGPLAKEKMDAIAGAVTEIHAGECKTSAYLCSSHFFTVLFSLLELPRCKIQLFER